MPRRSVADLTVVRPLPDPTRTRPRPSADAPENVRQVFDELLRSMPSGHFKPCDAPLLQCYAEAVLLSRRAFEGLLNDGPIVDGRPSGWVTLLEKGHRSCIALAARLRMAPQMRATSRATSSRRCPAAASTTVGISAMIH